MTFCIQPVPRGKTTDKAGEGGGERERKRESLATNTPPLPNKPYYFLFLFPKRKSIFLQADISLSEIFRDKERKSQPSNLATTT